jgi:hypothetical protein
VRAWARPSTFTTRWRAGRGGSGAGILLSRNAYGFSQSILIVSRPCL